MKLVKLNTNGLCNTYAIDTVEKEFCKAVDEEWKEKPPWQRYQKKLLGDLAILEEFQHNAIGLAGFEKLTTDNDLYSIRHPKTPKNIRVIFTFFEGSVILITAFLEKGDSDYKRAIDVANKRLKWLYDN